MEEDHLIERRVYPTVPPKVEYEITEIGKKIVPVMELMHQFGATYINTFREELPVQKKGLQMQYIDISPKT